LGGSGSFFGAGRFDTIDGLCEKVANKWPGPPQIQPQASDLRLFCSGKELGRNATAEDVGLFFIHLEAEVVVALEAVAGGARPLSACVGAAFAAGGWAAGRGSGRGGSRGPRGSVARATFPRPKLKAEQAAKKDSKKRARDDAQIGSDGLKSGGGSSCAAAAAVAVAATAAAAAVAVARLFFSLSLCPRGLAVLLARNKELEFFRRALVSDSFWVRFPAAF